MKNADMPATPCVNQWGAPIHHNDAGLHDGCMAGLTKREAMAMHMMPHVYTLFTTDGTSVEHDMWRDGVVIETRRMVDMLLAELDKCQKT